MRPKRNLLESRVLKNIQQYEKRKKLSLTTKVLAAKTGKRTGYLESFGRALQDYARIKIALAKHLGVLKGKKILHLASSTGVLTKYLQDKQAIAVGLDINRRALQIARRVKNRNQIQADASQNLPFASNSFDCFISDHFLFANYKPFEVGFGRVNHYKSRAAGSIQALKELHRILKPNGIGLLNLIHGRPLYYNQRKIEKMGFEFLDIPKNPPLGFISIQVIALRKKA